MKFERRAYNYVCQNSSAFARRVMAGATKEPLINSLHTIWQPISRLSALANNDISATSAAICRLDSQEIDKPSGVQAVNQRFLDIVVLLCYPV
jgi:hypothetical protein